MTSHSDLSFSHGKIQPQAVDLEIAVLGAIMLEKDALRSVIDVLKPEMFYKESHKIVYSAILSLNKKGIPADILTVHEELKKQNLLEAAGGAYNISIMTNGVSSSANIEYHTHIIIQKYIQRELIRVSSEIITDSFEDTLDIFEMLDLAEKKFYAINSIIKNGSGATSLKDGIIDVMKTMEAIKRMDGIGVTGVPSGYKDIDRMTSGWQKPDLVILAARPGMGKTALAVSMARNMAVDFNKPVAIFSLEMSTQQLVTRIMSAEANMSSGKLRAGDMSDGDWMRLNNSVSKLIDAPLYIDDTSALTVYDLRAKARRLVADYGVEMIFIDYLQLMAGDRNSRGNREQEISTISRSVKALAKELNIPIMALSQLSRAVEVRGGLRKPILSDLRESGAIEQDADLVLFIYRPEYYQIDQLDDGTSTEGLAIITFAKHRNGSLGDRFLRFVPAITRFYDYDEFDTVKTNDVKLHSSSLPPEADDDVPF